MVEGTLKLPRKEEMIKEHEEERLEYANNIAKYFHLLPFEAGDWTLYKKLAEIVPLPIGHEYFKGLSQIHVEVMKGFAKRDLKRLRATDFLPFFPEYCGDTSETF